VESKGDKTANKNSMGTIYFFVSNRKSIKTAPAYTTNEILFRYKNSTDQEQKNQVKNTFICRLKLNGESISLLQQADILAQPPLFAKFFVILSS
jgi:hypothetical protein